MPVDYTCKVASIKSKSVVNYQYKAALNYLHNQQPFVNINLMLKWIVSIILTLSLLNIGPDAVASSGTVNGKNVTDVKSCFKIKQASLMDHMHGIADWMGIIALDIVVGYAASAAGTIPQNLPSDMFGVTAIKGDHPCKVELDRLIETNENMLKAGRILFKHACYEESMIIFDEYARCYPDSPEAHYGIARIFAIRGNYLRAIDALKEAIRLNGDLKQDIMNDIYFESLRDLVPFSVEVRRTRLPVF